MKLHKYLTAILVICILLPYTSSVFAENSGETTVSEPAIWETTENYTISAGETQNWEIPVTQSGEYLIQIEYKTDENKVMPQAGISLIGPTIIADEETIDLSKIWSFAPNTVVDGRFVQDDWGNELMPSYVEENIWQIRELFPGRSSLYMEAGTYTLVLNFQRGEIQINSIKLITASAHEKYSEYYARISSEGAVNAKVDNIKQEAELIKNKSHQEISLTFDRTSPGISPNDPRFIRYNLLGGARFGTEGQWVSWEIDVPESGFYEWDFVYRQNVGQGSNIYRRLLIDNKVPFSECESVPFQYSESLRTQTISDEENNPYLFYLKAGKHIVSMEIVLADAREILSELTDIISELNLVYTQIMVIVGETPDSYRDYDLAANIPGLPETLKKSANKIEELANKFDKNGGSGSASLLNIARSLQSMRSQMRKMPQQMDDFRSQINTLADFLGSIRSQPMEIDYFVFRSPNHEPEPIKAGFWNMIKFRATAFLSSFFQDYASISGNDAIDPLNVWVNAGSAVPSGYSIGRDQAQIISRLAVDSFTLNTGIPVNFSLLDTNTLILALVSGKGPDAAVFVPEESIANLYYRNAVADLTDMPEFNDIKQRFYPSSLISLSLNNKLYALPEMQTFNMLYYRTDIFKNNKLDPPETWTEFYSVLKKIQLKGMQAGIPADSAIYEMLLYENGGSLYDENISSTNLTSNDSVNAFSQWSEFFTKYSIPLSYDALNRFRTGQMPLLINSVSFYGNLIVGAPEIAGQWEMLPIPAISNEDGSSRRSTCMVSGAVVLEKSKRKSDAFKFLDWWTSDTTQQSFAAENESVIGLSARYFPANKSVFDTISWSAHEHKVLETQMSELTDTPQSPATYYVTRNLNNAFRKAVYYGENPRDVVYRYGRIVDGELSRKRKELGLE